MSLFHIEGLESEGRRGLFWLLLGAIILLVSPPAWPALLAIIILGTVAGSVNVARLSRGKLDESKWWTVAYCVVLVGLIVMASESSKINALNAFGLGGIALGLGNVLPWFFGKRINEAVNRKFGFASGVAEDWQTEAMEQSEAKRALMVEFPDPIWERISNGMAETAVMVPAPRAGVRSRLGGRADLPSDFTTPVHGEIPLTYLAQVDLMELSAAFPASPLPKEGRLVFFYNQQEQPWGFDASDHGSGAIFHLEEPGAPASAEPEVPVIPVSFSLQRVPEVTDEFEQRMYELRRTLSGGAQRRFDLLRESAMPHTEGSRLLGYPEKVQNDMTSELREGSRSYGLPEETAWEMVLQLESHSELDWCWGDAGVLYYWVPANDLAAARFDRCWVVLQCT